MFKGSIVAIVTPIKNGKPDEKKFRELIEFQIKNGTHGIVPCGCTGEAATLNHDEQKKLISIAYETVNKRVLVIAGTGSNSTEEAVDLTSHARKVGCDGALLITPYYNKPTPEGQYRHYETIAKKVDIPLVLYNVPSRTGISILPETVAKLSKIDNIVAIKEASGSLDQVSKIISLCDITVLSGDDSLTVPMMSIGAKGVISVIANIAPADVAKMVEYALDENFKEARKMHYKLLPLFKGMFIETNPIPIKASLELVGILENVEWRLPLCEPEKGTVEKLKKVLSDYGFKITKK